MVNPMSVSRSAETFLIACYDISGARERRHASKFLESYGARVQRSVYELLLDGETNDRLQAAVADLAVGPVDSLRLYNLCPTCRTKVQVFGSGPKVERSIGHVIV